MRTIGQVAELAGVTVRALHHYDEIGLLSPSGRSEAGYRLYAHPDLERLQEILGWRRLGFSLNEIGAILDEPGYDRIHGLHRQLQLVEQEAERLDSLKAALEAAMTAERDGSKIEEAEMFNGFEPGEYEDEARERWGDSDAYKESTRRTASYGQSEWSEIRAEADEITIAFARLLDAGDPASGEAARALAERHRQHITRWFYPCPPEMHRALGEMYVADERFAHNYDKHADGLAIYVRDAIRANAETKSVLSD